MSTIKSGVIETASNTAVGLAVGYLAGYNPLRVAGVTACISVVSQVTRFIFEKTFEHANLSLFLSGKEAGHKRNLINATKLVIDTALGTLLAYGIGVGLFGMKVSLIPVIHFVGLALLVDFGRQLLFSTFYFIDLELRKLKIRPLMSEMLSMVG